MDELAAVSNEARSGAKSAQETADQTITVGKPEPAGKKAVELSRKTESLRTAETVTVTTTADQIRQVAGKTFYLLDGVWTDSEFKSDAKLPVVKLKFAGDEYFDLLGKEPKLAECFALGKLVVVVWNGKVYQVEE
jgi:hypothetical protein